MENYDILFDFSSSPIRGAVRRLDAYINFFSKTDLKVVFLVHAKVRSNYRLNDKVKIIYINKNILDKIFSINKYLDEYKLKVNWLFSYGVPINKVIAVNNWLHISNILPFNPNINIPILLKLKMYVLRLNYVRGSKMIDVVSAESQFSLDSYSSYITGPKLVPLYNGIEYRPDIKPLGNFLKYGNYAVISGTQPYKRVDKAYSLFLHLKNLYKLDNVLIIGSLDLLDSKYRSMPDVVLIDHLEDALYFESLLTSEIFITSTEVENSSCAVLEAICYCKKSYLSDIQSTAELLDINTVTKYSFASDSYFVVPKGALIETAFQNHNWTNEIKKFLKIMGYLR